jgi:hypothetical protein
VLAATIFGSSIAFIEASVINVVLPAIQQDLDVSVGEMQRVASVYTLFLAALTLAAGSASDRYGRRHVFALELAILAAASAAAACVANGTQHEHPDELRIDLDPVPGVEWTEVQAVAREVRGALVDFGLLGWPKTSGSRGIHVNVRLHPRWSFSQVRRAARALAREVERRAPSLATSKWWKDTRAFLRSGSSSCASRRLSAIVNDEVTPTWWSVPCES